MRFRNLTRRREIGANSYLLETGAHRIVMDSGMDPKATGFSAIPDFGPLPLDSADAIILTHAHHDHIGSLPVLQNRQPNAPVFMTEATGEVGSAMLHNSVNVMMKQREEHGIHEYPMFTHRELDDIRSHWIYRDFDRPFFIPDTEIQCSFHDAGHIIGSAGVMIREDGHGLFYTGDVNFESQTIAKGASFPDQDIDVLIMETTRGDHVRRPDYTRKSEKERMATVICETWEAGGSVLIPVFALGKTQEALLMLHELYEQDLIPEMPVFIGGLSTKITVLYDHYSNRVPRHYSGFRLLEDIKMLVAPNKKRREINYQTRAIYALSSGMMTEKTTSNQFAWKILENPKNTICFVGYCDPDSPGGKIRGGKPGEMIKLDPKLPAIPLNCRVESFDFSAHATRESLCEFAEKVRPKKLLLVHGDEPAQIWFENRFRETLPACEVIRPETHVPIELW